MFARLDRIAQVMLAGLGVPGAAGQVAKHVTGPVRDRGKNGFVADLQVIPLGIVFALGAAGHGQAGIAVADIRDQLAGTGRRRFGALIVGQF